ncbi:response regulator [Qipengyuania marisflavi]|uniref:Response regulator n=1 Tax=Qipengyuania marisflavi TaxID=2486356 RepID=A0A5S3PAW5_9SPHN|nr:response regulator [Qipengyuania marisflavi]TMM48188.1 response regulator [Qipengyuania marisflavi]
MASRPASSSGATKQQPAVPARREELRILLAEDNCIAAELLRMMGDRLGAKMDWVENGLDAVDTVHRAREAGLPYALLLMDAMMPVLSGAEATRRLRANGISPEELPIVAVTAATANDEVRDLFDSGMQAYLAKPVSIADLSACFDAWVTTRPEAGAPIARHSFDALRRRYALRKTEVFSQLEECVSAGNCADEETSALRNHLHKLAGTAGSFGEEALSAAAAEAAGVVAAAQPGESHAALAKALALIKAVG